MPWSILPQFFGQIHLQYEGYLVSFIAAIFVEIFELITNSVDPAASDHGLHCLPMSLLWDARHKWVNF